jgi:hydrophobic/amphiphilic exporter-1 (mainly G- bacteria), HAE1 family
MKKLPQFSVKFPTTVMMLVLAILLLGYIAFQRLGVDLLPDLNSPRLFVEVDAGEIPPEEMEETFVSPMEAVIARGSSVENVSSISRVGKGLITVQYGWDTDMDEAFLDLQKMMADFSQNSDVDEVVVSRHDPNAAPIIVATLSYKNGKKKVGQENQKRSNRVAAGMELNNLRRIAEKNIRNELIRLEGVAAVETVGGLKREIEVKTDALRLEAYGLTMEQLANTVKNSNRNMTGGSIVEMGLKYTIRGVGQLTSLEDIKNLIVSQQKEPILLKDVADITYVLAEPENIVRLNGERCIALEIFKESRSNTLAAAKSIEEQLQYLGKSLPDIELRVIQDQSGFIESAVTEVEQTGLIGIFLAVLVLFVFLRRVGITFVISIAIPISIVATFNLMYFNDLTLNVMTLGGLALGAGMLVDNAIVVVENIFRHLEEGRPLSEAAVTGAGEVAGAITSSTLTTIVVFLPIVYLHGAAGELFKEQAWTVAFSLLSSLFVALAVIPMLCAGMLSGKSVAKGREKKITAGALHFHGYGNFLEKILKRRLPVVIAAAVLVAAAILAVPYVGSEFIPHTDLGELNINLSMPEGTALERTETTVKTIEQMIERRFGEHIKHLYSRVGPGGSTADLSNVLMDENNATIQLVLKRDTHLGIPELTDWLDHHLSGLPDLEAQIVTKQTVLHSTLGTIAAPLIVEIKGKDLDVLTKLSEQARDVMKNIPALVNIETGFQGGRPEIDIAIDRTAASQFSLQVESIGSQVKNILSGVDSGRIEENGEYVDILLRTPELTPGQLEGILLETSSGTRVRLDEVATITRSLSPREIVRNNQTRVAQISAHITGDMAFDKVADQVRTAIGKMGLPTEYTFDVTGEEKLRAQSFGGLKFALLLAVLLVYMVMASQFESLLYPFVILLTIPLAFVGAVFLLMALGMPFNIMSFIGIIMLAGIAVNDSIILVDRINRNRSEGMALTAAIVKAGETRIRPIIMTSITTILALLPLTFGIGEGAALRAPMAIAVIGGLFTSTALTLVVIPCVYRLLTRKKHA